MTKKDRSRIVRPSSRAIDAVTRRRALKGLGAAAGTAAFGSGCEEESTINAEYDLFGFGKGCKAVNGLEAFRKVDTFVVLMMENRSFDHMFGSLKAVEGREDVNGLTGDESNPDPRGGNVRVFHQTDLALGDIDHEWSACHAQHNGGANDGFVRAHVEDLMKAEKLCDDPVNPLGDGYCAGERDPMAYYTRAELPTSYQLADAYTLCDRWFCSVMGPTWPNRFYLHAATAEGRMANKRIWSLDTIWKALDEKCLSGVNFYADLPWATGAFVKLKGLARVFDKQIGIKDTFEQRAREGRLPTLSVIDPGFFIGNDDHPPADVGMGQAFINTIYKILAASPQWERMCFIVTYDEHGSFYDHVAPPKVEDEHPEFQQLGFRVPSLVIGPYVKQGYVDSTQYDHVSVISTLTARFGLRVLNDRVLATNDLSDVMDPELVDDPQPGAEIAAVTVSEARARESMERVQHHGDRELARLADRGDIPPELDHRHRNRETLDDLLELGERYGAIRVVP